MKYFHKETTLGAIEIKGDGLQVDCVATVIRMTDRGPHHEQELRFQIYNRTPDHVGGMKPLIDAALQKGKELAAAYIAAREEAARQQFVNTLYAQPWTDKGAAT